MEHKIGEVFAFGSWKLKVEAAPDEQGCDGCFFAETLKGCIEEPCTADSRTDGQDVIFAEVAE